MTPLRTPTVCCLLFSLSVAACGAGGETLPPAEPHDAIQAAAPQVDTPETEPQTSPEASGEYEPSVGQEGKDVVWVPTSDALVEAMLDLGEVGPGDFVIDLGSGDGRTVIAAARRGARAKGIEFNPDLVVLSRRRAAEAGVGGLATFEEGDLFETDLSGASVITMFLLPEINLKLRPILLDLKPGTRIVSNSFSMDEWEEDDRTTLTADQDCESWCTALLWIVPAKVAGTWGLPEGELVLRQEFQRLYGTLNGETIAEGRMRGTEITFSVGPTRYSGRVNGNSIEGTMTGASSGSWTATRRIARAPGPDPAGAQVAAVLDHRLAASRR